MGILRDKNTGRFLIVLILLSGILFLGGYFACEKMTHSFKESMLTQDYAIAGYMLEHGRQPSEIAPAFTREKSPQQIQTGKALLESVGYQSSLNNRFLPEFIMLDTQNKTIILGLIAIFTMCFLSVGFLYWLRQRNVLSAATQSIHAFMNGDLTSRIDSENEGELALLFAAVNEMATVLHTHVEAEKQTKEFLKNTMADISHQLKTPLTAIKMYNEIIQEEADDPETVHKFAQKTSLSLQRMETLIQNLLKITRLDTGMIQFKKRPERIIDIVQEIIFDFETRASQEKKSLSFEGAATTRLSCDKDWMTEAISNLVKNGVDHTKAGGQIHIVWRETPVIIQIEIHDNGAGIHPADIHHIFKRFYRSRFSQATEGVGLGLSLAKSIIESHDGTISVSSKLQQGSTFTLSFLKLTKE